VTASKGGIIFNGNKDIYCTQATITSNTMSDWATGTAVPAAMVITNCEAVTLTLNEIKDVPAVGTLGMGHAVRMWTTKAWSITGLKNKFTGNGGGVAIITAVHNGGADFTGKIF